MDFENNIYLQDLCFPVRGETGITIMPDNEILWDLKVICHEDVEYGDDKPFSANILGKCIHGVKVVDLFSSKFKYKLNDNSGSFYFSGFGDMLPITSLKAEIYRDDFDEFASYKFKGSGVVDPCHGPGWMYGVPMRVFTGVKITTVDICKSIAIEEDIAHIKKLLGIDLPLKWVESSNGQASFTVS